MVPRQPNVQWQRRHQLHAEHISYMQLMLTFKTNSACMAGELRRWLSAFTLSKCFTNAHSRQQLYVSETDQRAFEVQFTSVPAPTRSGFAPSVWKTAKTVTYTSIRAGRSPHRHVQRCKEIARASVINSASTRLADQR